MKLRTRLDVFSAALLSALGASQVVACGGTVFSSGEGGAGGSGAGASGAGAGSAGTSGSAGSSTTGGGGTTGSSGSGGAGNHFPCKNPKDDGTGIITCDGGWSHRASAVTCTSKVPRPEPIPSTVLGTQCKSDADCVDHPFGFCTYGGQAPGSYCNYGCINDSDCSGSALCACGDPVGVCHQADCKTDAECGAGFLCIGYDSSGGCGNTRFTCQSAADECSSNADCAGSVDGICNFDSNEQRFECKTGGCVVGRPFLVDGAARVAPASMRADWRELALLPRLKDATPALSSALAEAWTRVALMEHASIAAFARFTLQLMSLGAPAKLIELATSAMADETKHAKACFAVASAYAGAPIGPGPLAIEQSLDATSLEEIVLNTIREGCVGEAVAAVEAREAAEHTWDPALKALLLVISEDETRHAELAFRFVQWALSIGDDALATAVHAEFAALRLETTPPTATRSGDAAEFTAQLLSHGIASQELRAAIRARAISDVILPCAGALQAGARAERRALRGASLACDRPDC